jgi:general secretion pathway protein H
MTGGERGFTLIELLVVLAIMGMVAAIALPLSVRAVDGATLRADGRALAVALKLLQAEARARQDAVVVEARDGTLYTTAPHRFPRTGSGAVLGFKGGRRLVFYPDGTSSGATLQLTEHGRSVDIEVAWLTGLVAVRSVP